MARRTTVREHVARAVLGGWVLLASPSAQQPNAPQADWEEMRDFPTAFECETARREEALEQAARQAKSGSKGGNKSGQRTENAALDAMLRYRCKYTKHPQPRWRRWVRKAVGRLRLAGGSAP